MDVALKGSRYWGPQDQPHTPFVKQMAFMLLSNREALYGGGVGGAKSDTLLMSALQYVDIPGYAALIIRRNLTDLKQPGNLLDRANNWLKSRPELRFDGSSNTYYFPTKRLNGLPGEPAKLVFGFLSKERSLDRYQGGEYQFIAFDELTQFREKEYEYLDTRLRQGLCPQHGDKPSSQCGDCMQLQSVPLRLRAASNPGGVGNDWVRDRFKIRRLADGRWRGFDPERPFIPSYLYDNPFIDKEPYIKSLERQHPSTRDQLLRGDWDVTEESRFKRHWARYYTMRGNHFVLEHEGKGRSFHIGEAQKIFTTMDPAISRKDYVKKDGKKRSHCVISTWAFMPSCDLLLIGHRRFQGELDIAIQHAKSVYTEFKPEYFRVETNNMGEVVRQLLVKNGIRTIGKSSSIDKVSNSVEAAVRMSEGHIWFPQSAPYLTDLESEIFTWTGDEEEQDDQVDNLSNAVHEVSWEAFAQSREQITNKVSATFAPFVYR